MEHRPGAGAGGLSIVKPEEKPAQLGPTIDGHAVTARGGSIAGTPESAEVAPRISD